MAGHSTRREVPTPAVLGLSSRHAADDLHELGWDSPQRTDLLWALAGSGDPDLALNTLMRITTALEDNSGTADKREFLQALEDDETLRVRVIALLGGSAAIGEHLAAHPEVWVELRLELPDAEEMMHGLLSAVEATPADFALDDDADVTSQASDTATAELTKAGTYRAGIDGDEAMTALTVTYRTLLMRIAAADLAGTYPSTRRHKGLASVEFSTVTGLLADLADAALTAALAVAVTGVYGNEGVDTHLAVIAMGKCGARELNYISDVDVIFVAEPTTPKATRLAGEFARIGSRCFFEVDANLRPEGRSGALVRSVESHLAYYRRWAHTWEFQALLKARPQTGHKPTGEAYLQGISPMVWEASRRDSFVEDVQAMRRRVLDNVPDDVTDRELKLGRGGLRDVEFAVQLLQLVHGRYDESLRVRDTVSGLEALAAGGYIGREDATSLSQAYEFLRLLEHRLQLHRMKRTHMLPSRDNREQLIWLARTAGFTPRSGQSSEREMEVTLRRVRLLVSSLHSRLFYRPLLNSVVNLSADALKLSPEAAKLQLGALGYSSPERAFEHLSALASGSSRKARIQAVLLPTFMEWLGTTADPDAGLLNYRKLSEAAKDRSWFLRLLRDEGVVGQRLMWILGTSPYTASLIISAPDFVKLLGDGANGPKLIASSSRTAASSLVAAAGRKNDPDQAITVARSLRRAELARIASADLLGMIDTPRVCHDLSRVWNAVLEAALRAEIKASVKDRGHDEAPARIAVIGMGRLGGAELGYGSDADVLFVAQPAEGIAENEAIKWAVTVCDKLRTRLAKPSGDPPLEVDVGLRPEGRSGVLVRTVASYRRYYKNWGEVWEYQALLRAAHVAGDKDLGVAFLRMADEFRYPKGGTDPATIREVRRIKARVDTERLPRGADRNTHTKLGRGGLSDIEWTVQLLTMMHGHDYPGLHDTSTLAALDVIGEVGLLSELDVSTLREAWLEVTNTRNALVLVRGKRTDQVPVQGMALVAVAAAAGWPPDNYQEFLENYLKVTRRARKVVDEVFWGEQTMEP